MTLAQVCDFFFRNLERHSHTTQDAISTPLDESAYWPKLHMSSTRTASRPVPNLPSEVIVAPTQAWACVPFWCQRSSARKPKDCETGRLALPTWTFCVASGKALLFGIARGFSSSSNITTCCSPSGAQEGWVPQSSGFTSARRLSRQTMRSLPPDKGPPPPHRTEWR